MVDAAARAWSPPPARDTSPPPVDPVEYANAEVYASLIALGAATSPRNLQATIGSSEVGFDCDRRLVYRLRNIPAVAKASQDPLASLRGIGFHSVLSDVFARLDGGAGRFLIEQEVIYRDIPGVVDLYDRARAMVVDWKTTSKERIRQYRREGPPRNYTTQVQMYGAGLKALGENPRQVSLVFIPYDGGLDAVWSWVRGFDIRIADDAVDRLERLRALIPANATAHPDRSCQYCNHHMPGTASLNVGCPGPENDSEATPS